MLYNLQLETIAKMIVGNINSFRVCVLKSHSQYPRCGQAPKETRNRPLK